ncbi:MAG: hypothetical protein NT090_12195, partial [Acidobacteria bacterium]|nr:hypothetical protein [Acidobacteriota bacterium]
MRRLERRAKQFRGAPAGKARRNISSQGKVFWLFASGYTDFVMGPFVYRNRHAAFIELVLPLAVMGALRKVRNAWICAILAASMIASVIASASRAGTALV